MIFVLLATLVFTPLILTDFVQLNCESNNDLYNAFLDFGAGMKDCKTFNIKGTMFIGYSCLSTGYPQSFDAKLILRQGNGSFALPVFQQMSIFEGNKTVPYISKQVLSCDHALLKKYNNTEWKPQGLFFDDGYQNSCIADVAPDQGTSIKTVPYYYKPDFGTQKGLKQGSLNYTLTVNNDVGCWMLVKVEL